MRIFSTLFFAVVAWVLPVTAYTQTPISASFRSGFGAFGIDIDGAVPAIQGFDVAYTNGDHQIRDLHIAPTDSSYLLLMRDSSGVDPIRGSVKLLDVRDLEGERYRVSKRDCIGRCQISLPFSVPHGYALVLLGFDFHYSTVDGGTDTNIREISVIPWPHNAYVEVYFGDTAGTERYYAQVDFTLLPESSLEFYDQLASASSPVQGSQTVVRDDPRGRALLQAFQVRFTESDHFLRRFQVDLSRDRIRVSFYDRDLNDPYLWWLRYAVLRRR